MSADLREAFTVAAAEYCRRWLAGPIEDGDTVEIEPSMQPMFAAYRAWQEDEQTRRAMIEHVQAVGKWEEENRG